MSSIVTSSSAPAAPARFAWEDPLLLDDQLTDEERMIRDVARDFAQEKLLPRVVEACANETVDPGLSHEMGVLGLLGVTIAEAS